MTFAKAAVGNVSNMNDMLTRKKKTNLKLLSHIRIVRSYT